MLRIKSISHKMHDIYNNVNKMQNSKQYCSNSQLIQSLKEQGIIKSNIVYYTFLSIDRKNFIPQPPFYWDKSSPIGYGAIISAPHMHAYALEYMLEALSKAKFVLDVGSGSGILTLAMALVTPKNCKVYGIQHMPQLVEQSIKNIKKQNQALLSKISIVVGDARKGFTDRNIKFDAIHVGAASQQIPMPLIEQLAEDGIIIMPIGKQKSAQKFMKFKKTKGQLIQIFLQHVCYVPLTDPAYQLIR